jgi:hypothetical protein
MKTIEIVARLFGRQFLKLEITTNEISMAKEEKKVSVLITDAYGIGYVAGREYEVNESEAVKLIEAKKAIPVTEPKKETATAKPVAKETRKGK